MSINTTYISYHKSYPFIFVTSLTSGVQCIQKLSSEGIPDTGPVHFADVLGDRSGPRWTH